VLTLPLDVTDRGQVTEAVEQALQHFGSIDVLFNNAGIGYFAAVEEATRRRSAGSWRSTCSASPPSRMRSCRPCGRTSPAAF
jgi:NAD(P)-dependent dehydrogenase (short-subunit alcohol dehydrogenase family)